MEKSKIAEKEIEVAKWMNKKGYDRRASKDIAPVIVEYLREFKLLNLHSVSNAERTCPHCGSLNVIMFSADDDICNDCGKYFPGA